MGVLARLGMWLGEKRAASPVDASGVLREMMFGGAAAASGANVNWRTALGVTTVLDGTRTIAEDVSGLPLGVYLRQGPNRVPAADDWLQYLLDRPNDWQDGTEFREQMTAHAVLCGNAVAMKVKVRGEVREMLPLDPSWYTIERQDDWGLIYKVSLPDGTRLDLRRDDVFHLRGLSWSGFAGMDIVRLAREAIGLAMATEEHHARLHVNGSRPGGILSTDAQLSEDTIKRLKMQWEARYGGVENSFKTAILEQGLKWTPVAMTAVDAQHLETRKMQIEEICRALRIFPQMVGHAGDQSATFASAEQFFLAHVKFTILPWVNRWEAAIRRDLIGRRNLPLYVKHSVAALERADIKTRYEAYRIAIEAGFMLPNQARELEDWSPVPGLDRPRMPANFNVLDDEGNPPPKPGPATATPPRDNPDA